MSSLNFTYYELDDFIGEQVFVRNGTDEPIKKGILKGYQDHHSGSALPVVEIDGEDLLCFGMLFPYSVELQTLLTTMKPQHQMDFLIKIKHFISANNRKCRGGKN